MSSHRDRLAAGWHAAWNEGELGAIDALMTPDYRRCCRDTAHRDVAGLKQEIVVVRTAFPDLSLAIDDTVCEGDRVVTKWTVTGTHDGPFGAVPPTHERVSLAGLTLSTFRGDRVATDWLTWDPQDMVRVLGIISIGGIGAVG
jgi:predicted ester cyclase